MENQSNPIIDENDRQPAESSAESQAAAPTETETAKPYVPAKTSMVGRWFLIILGTLIVGFAAAFFVLYVPAARDLRQAKSDFTTASDKLATTTADLQTTTGKLESTTRDLAEARFTQALARVQANVAYARLALVTRDLLTARQEVSAAGESMSTLLPLISDSETSKALEDRMGSIQKLIVTDSAKALEELRTLSENLLRLQSR